MPKPKNSTYLFKRIKQTSKHRKWLSILFSLIFFVWFLSSLLTLALSQLPPEVFVDGVVPTFDIFGFICIIICLVYSLWNWAIGKRNQKKPQTHSVIKALMQGGGALDNLEQFENEIAAKDALEFPNLILGEHWIFYNGYYRLRLRNTAEIVCVFDRKTSSTSFLTRWASKKRDIVIGFADKKSWTVRFDKNIDDIEVFKKSIGEMFPHVVIENEDMSSHIIQKKWEAKPDEILELVAMNRMRMRKAEKQEKQEDKKEDNKKERQEKENASE
jgi:hypothetical protein